MAEITFACPGCSETLSAPDDMAGMVVQCPACEQEMTVPAPEAADTPVSVLYAIEQTSEPAVPDGKSCQGCGVALAETAVICIQCGFNLKTGKKLDTRFSKAKEEKKPPATEQKQGDEEQ